MCGLLSCAPGPRPAERRGWEQDEFLIGLRGAPPTKSEHYARVAQAGFNVVMGHVGPDALDLARRHGLKLAVSRIGMDVGTFASVEGRRRAMQLIAQCRGHRALWGYHLGDGARQRDFAAYGRLASFVAELDPMPPVFIGLHGAGAWVGPALASGDYPGYQARFIRTARPMLLSAPLAGGDLSFDTLEHLRRAALDHGLPFCVTAPGADSRGVRSVGAGALRSRVYASLAYGARGIIWSGMRVVRRGGATDPYARVAPLNRELRTLGATLLGLRSLGVYHVGKPLPRGVRSLPARTLVGSVEGGAFVVGLFEDPRRRSYVFLVNKDALGAAMARMVIHGTCEAVAWLDVADGRWKALAIERSRFETKLEVPLRPGGGKLLRLTLLTPP